MNAHQKSLFFNAIILNNCACLEDYSTQWLDEWTELCSDVGLELHYPLHLAAEHNAVDCAALILTKNPKLISQWLYRGYTPLLFAAKHGHKAMVEFLLNHGANLQDTVSRWGNTDVNATALILAINSGHPEVVEFLVRRGAFQLPQKKQMQIVLDAMPAGSLLIMRSLLKTHTLLINSVHDSGQTLLLSACRYGHFEIVNYLISNGADIEQPQPITHHYKGTPLHAAIEGGFYKIICCLVENFKTKPARPQSLLSSLFPTISWLDQLNVRGESALFLAARRGDINVVKYLFEQGAQSHIPLIKHTTPMRKISLVEWVIEHGHDAILEYLQCKGLRADQFLHDYHRAHWAVSHGHTKMVMCFLDGHHEWRDRYDSEGYTFLLLAVKHGYTEIVNYLLAQDHCIHSPVNKPEAADHGLDALPLAIKYRHYDIAHQFIQQHLRLATQKTQTQIFDCINTAEHALDLMVAHPIYIQSFKSIPRIMDMIAAWSAYPIDQHIGYYKAAGRRPSFYAHINLQLQTVTVYKPIKVLGQGGFGKVRKFESGQGESLAVKSSLSNVSSQKMKSRLKDNVQELHIMSVAYSDSTPYLYQVHCFYQASSPESYHFRSVMPYKAGDRLDVYFERLSTVQQIITLLISLVIQINELHSKGIIHGDIKADNILVESRHDECITSLIDFGLAYFDRSEEISGFDPHHNSQCVWYLPPERFTKLFKPSVKQDIFSFAAMLLALIRRHPQAFSLYENQSFIWSFIEKSMDSNPQARPTLASFLDELTQGARQNFSHMAV